MNANEPDSGAVKANQGPNAGLHLKAASEQKTMPGDGSQEDLTITNLCHFRLYFAQQ